MWHIYLRHCAALCKHCELIWVRSTHSESLEIYGVISCTSEMHDRIYDTCLFLWSSRKLNHSGKGGEEGTMIFENGYNFGNARFIAGHSTCTR